jgi:lipopolysaccharide/colanic/teichoic acid biosynthesis glycosyltransferase
MQTSTLPQIATSLPSAKPVEATLLFIESPTTSSAAYHMMYTESYFVADFEEAKNLLYKLDILNQLPDMIVINQHLDKTALAEFKSWMTQTFTAIVPVIYHQNGMSKADIKDLIKSGLVHDVTDINEHAATLNDKAVFLKKAVNQAKNMRPTQRKKFNCNKCEYAKRTMDIVLALIAITLCLPLFLLIAIAIKLESRGPVFYNALRAGRGYKIFKFYKFRTMVVNADKQVKDLAAMNQYKTENGPNFFKVKNDPRITKVGAFLRNTSLDELPQLFNVLKGDMSFVGNRPLPLYEATSLTTDEWSERFMAPAGITGLWQISRRGKEDMNPIERISLDINYARNRTLTGDVKILLKTPTVLIQKANV